MTQGNKQETVHLRVALLALGAAGALMAMGQETPLALIGGWVVTGLSFMLAGLMYLLHASASCAATQGRPEQSSEIGRPAGFKRL